MNANSSCFSSPCIASTSTAREEFLSTSTNQVEKESVSLASTDDESIVSSLIATPTSSTNLASGTVSSLHYTKHENPLILLFPFFANLLLPRIISCSDGCLLCDCLRHHHHCNDPANSGRGLTGEKEPNY